jgi:hypothetical protein
MVHHYLYIAALALHCVQRVGKREGQSTSQHPTRPIYDKLEVSRVNNHKNRATFFRNHLNSVAVKFEACSVFQVRRKLIPVQNIVHFTVAERRPISVLDGIAFVRFLQSRRMKSVK